MEQGTYLGDGVYVKKTDWDIMIYTSNGVNTTHEIHLELDVLHHFIEWLKRENIIENPKG